MVGHKEPPMQELAKRLSEAFGVSGFEDEIRAVIRAEIAGLVDEISVDTLGNLIAVRRGRGGKPSVDLMSTEGLRVMLAAHMDQIGLMVTHVDEKGYLRFAPVGYLYPLACWGAQVRFADGTVGSIGLDGRKNPAKELPELRDMYVDVGGDRSRPGAAEGGRCRGVLAGLHQPGQRVVLAQPGRPRRLHRVGPTPPRVAGRRDCPRHLRGFHHSGGGWAPWARTSAYAIEPDLAIALDVTLTGDAPYATPAMEVYMGRGVAIKVQDAGMISHPGLNRLLIAAAEAEGIPYQLEVLQGGTTDAYAIQVSRGGGAGHLSVHSQPPRPHPLADRGSARRRGRGQASEGLLERAHHAVIEPRRHGEHGVSS